VKEVKRAQENEVDLLRKKKEIEGERLGWKVLPFKRERKNRLTRRARSG